MNSRLSLGVLISLTACFLYSGMAAIIKDQASLLPPLPVVVFMQNLVGLILILPAAIKSRSITSRRIPLHILRALFSLMICYFLYYAVTYIPLVNAMLLSNSSPLIVPFVGYLFFSERINHQLWLPVILGYIGVALVLNPDAHLFNFGALLAFGSAVALAFTIQCVRKLTTTDSTTTITFYFLLFSAIFSGIISIPFWQPITLSMLAVMSLIGFLYFTSQYLANASIRYASPQLIGSLMYSNVVYAAIIAFFVWHTLPSMMTVAGMMLIIVGGIACIRVENRPTAKIEFAHS